jgi:hypothetical protein
MSDLVIPKPWVVELDERPRRLILEYRPGSQHREGAVTLDFDRRKYDFGFMTHGVRADRVYQGRGWQQKLINDALAAFQKECLG